MLRSAAGVAGATLASRVLGVARDVLLAKILGGGALMSAWVLAFTIPNLSRRLLGEGAMGSALVPALSRDLRDDETNELAGRRFAALMASLGALLGALCAITALVAIIAKPLVSSPMARLTFQVLPLIVPYALFACLSGVSAAALNSFRRFTLPALTSLLLNIALIAALLLADPLGLNGENLLDALAVAVLVAGAAQLAAMLLMLRAAGLPLLRPKGLGATIAQTAADAKSEFGKEVWKLALPGMLGAGALQISFFMDRLLASLLGPRAVPALYYSDRIVYLAIGVFAVAMGGVVLPDLSRLAAGGDNGKMARTMTTALRHLVFICVPVSAFTFVCGEDIIKLLFMRGAFDTAALDAAKQALMFYVWGVPFFATVKILVAGFYARKEMKTPVRISILCVSVNIVLNLILMWPLRQGGIALATVLSSVLNNTLLVIMLRGRLPEFKPAQIAVPAFRAVVAAAVAGAAAWYSLDTAQRLVAPLTESLRIRGLEVIPAAAVFGAVYLATALILAAKEPREWLETLKPKI